MPQTLRKSHRLHHKSLTDALFASGNTLNAYPLKAFWRPLSEGELTETFRNHVPDLIGRDQILISVPKRRLHHAVDRVRVRRLIREAYRLNRAPLVEALSNHPEIRTLSLGFVYSADKLPDYAKITTKMQKIITDLIEKISELHICKIIR
ncbi:MAG: ribonuclease P protein component [Clostridium sp.]|nr:ribonuclease P protein component [Prevotella sp.]MCM1428476.1 ribonuclease P protein component [Clostridium sp.]